MSTFPYIRVKQRGEIFFLTKFSVSYLFEKVNLHFRDPYLHMQGKRYEVKNDQYLEEVRRKGLELATDNDEGVQRRLQLNRILDIKKYIDDNISNYFPNSVLISADTSMVTNFDEQAYLNMESLEVGEFQFPEEVRFSVIDGQHRLAGLFQARNIDKDRFEVPVVLLLNASLPTAAKLFSDINGKQKAVSKSLVYDLYEFVDDKSVAGIKKYHTICQKFYTDEKSPLFRQIKMLGIGGGAISQSFFIDMALKYAEPKLEKVEIQKTYNELFYYYRAYQKIFPEDWPVPLEPFEERRFDEYAELVLKHNKSQLLKTNGFGAIMRAFPQIYERATGSFDNYLEIVGQLQNRIHWRRDQLQQAGGGVELQKYLFEQIVNILNLQ